MGLRDRAVSAADDARRAAAQSAAKPRQPDPEAEAAKAAFMGRLEAWFELMGIDDPPKVGMGVRPNGWDSLSWIEVYATWTYDGMKFKAHNMLGGSRWVEVGITVTTGKRRKKETSIRWYSAESPQELGEAIKAAEAITQ